MRASCPTCSVKTETGQNQLKFIIGHPTVATAALRMNEDVKKVLVMDNMREKMEQFGAENGGGGMEKFAAFIQAEQQKWVLVASQG